MNPPSNKLLDLLKISPKTQPIRKKRMRWNRNWKCVCGSDKKYKKCCMKEIEELNLIDQNATFSESEVESCLD